MKIDFITIGLRIRKLRRQKLWTQEKLSEKAEIAPDYLCRIELGKKHPSLKAILQIAHALNTTVDDLLADSPKKNMPDVENEIKYLLEGCTEKQKRFMITICEIIKEEMLKYDEIK